MGSPQFKAVADAAAARIVDVLDRWLPGGTRKGREYLARNPKRADESPGSFSINLRTGRWSDFATGDKGGDLIALVAYLEGCKPAEARDRLAAFLGVRSDEKRPQPRPAVSEWRAIVPIPADAPSPPLAHSKLGRAITTWTYRDHEGRTLFLVYRFEERSGDQVRKHILPCAFCEGPQGRRAWRWQGLPEPRPLYRLDALSARPGAIVIVCEGEKAAEAAALLMPDCVATTMPNGAQSPRKADWAPLRGRAVLLWPDADAPGRTCMAAVAKLAQAAGAASVQAIRLEALTVVRGAALPEGWDAADAMAEGWTAERMQTVRRRADLLAAPAGELGPAASELPRGYVLEDGGLYFLERNDRGDTERHWICSPLRVAAVTRDERGENWGMLLEFPDRDGALHRWAMAAELLKADGAEYRGALLGMGLQIAPGMKARNWLTSYLQLSRPCARARCVERTGWHEAVFVLPERTIGESSEPVLFQSVAGFASAYRERGTLDDWRMHVARLCAGNSRLVFAVSAAFAAMLMQIAEAESGGFHLRGASSTGKTTVLRVAASVFGGPNYLRRWRSTDNALEALAMQHCGTLLILDELSQVDPRVAGEVAYMLANGDGKARANRAGGLRSVVRWELLFLSSGETSLADHMMQVDRRPRAGQEVRLLDVPADAGAGLGVFETLHGAELGAKFARALDQAVRRYYGTAAVVFLERAAKLRDQLPELLEEARRMFSAGTLPDGGSGQAHRTAASFALVGAGGELATRFGITGWLKGEAIRAAEVCFRAWLAARGGAGDQESRVIMAQVREFFERHGEARFVEWGRAADDHAPRTQNRAGVRRATEGSTEFYVLPGVFAGEICKGFDSRDVAHLLLRAGVLNGEDEKPYCRVHLPTFGRVRCYHFAPKLWTVGDETA